MKAWCENILVAVMISTLIEMLLPEGKSQKYIRVVIGIYIIFTILQPVLKFTNTSISLEDVLSKLQTQNSDIRDIENIENIEKDQEDYLKEIEENLKKEVN